MKVGDWVKLGEFTGVLVRPVIPRDKVYTVASEDFPAWWALFIGDQELMWSYEENLCPVKKEIR